MSHNKNDKSQALNDNKLNYVRAIINNVPHHHTLELIWVLEKVKYVLHVYKVFQEFTTFPVTLHIIITFLILLRSSSWKLYSLSFHSYEVSKLEAQPADTFCNNDSKPISLLKQRIPFLTTFTNIISLSFSSDTSLNQYKACSALPLLENWTLIKKHCLITDPYLTCLSHLNILCVRLTVSLLTICSTLLIQLILNFTLQNRLFLPFIITSWNVWVIRR